MTAYGLGLNSSATVHAQPVCTSHVPRMRSHNGRYGRSSRPTFPFTCCNNTDRIQVSVYRSVSNSGAAWAERRKKKKKKRKKKKKKKKKKERKKRHCALPLLCQDSGNLLSPCALQLPSPPPHPTPTPIPVKHAARTAQSHRRHWKTLAASLGLVGFLAVAHDWQICG